MPRVWGGLEGNEGIGNCKIKNKERNTRILEFKINPWEGKLKISWNAGIILERKNWEGI